MAPTPSGLSLALGGCTILNATSPSAIRQCVRCPGFASGRLFVNRRSLTGRFDISVIVSKVCAFPPRTPTATGEK